MSAVDLTGRRFGRLRVLARGEYAMIGGRKRAVWQCVCRCGAERPVLATHLVTGHTTSCGCARLDAITTHGSSGAGEYKSWRGMRQRCGNPKDPRFRDYGARGITMCARWLSFENFLTDMGRRPGSDYSIERVDNDRGYEPSNCKWATRSEQQRNKRVQRNNSSGVNGVSKDGSGRWMARIKYRGKDRYLGTHDSIEAAAVARKEGEQTYWGRP